MEQNQVRYALMGITISFTVYLLYPLIQTWGPYQIVMFGFVGWTYFTSLTMDEDKEEVVKEKVKVVIKQEPKPLMTEKLIQCDRIASFVVPEAGEYKKKEELTSRQLDLAWLQVEPGNLEFKNIITQQGQDIVDLEDELRESEMQRQSDQIMLKIKTQTIDKLSNNFMKNFKAFEGPEALINRTQNDINNTTIIASNNDTQVIDDFSKVDIKPGGGMNTTNGTNMSVSKIIDDIHVNLIETQEEKSLLEDLESRQIFHMRQSLKDYIISVQTERSNIYKQVKPLQNNFNKMRYALVELKDEKDELRQYLEDSVKNQKEWETKFIAKTEQADVLSKFVQSPGQTAKKIHERFLQFDFKDLSSIADLQKSTTKIEKCLKQQSYSQDFTQKLTNKFKRPIQSQNDERLDRISELSHITKDQNGTRLQIIQEDVKIFEDDRQDEQNSASNLTSQRIGNNVQALNFSPDQDRMNRTSKDNTDSLIQDKKQVVVDGKDPKINTNVFSMNFSDEEEEQKSIVIQERATKAPVNSVQVKRDNQMNALVQESDTIKGSFHDINIENINENILKLQGQEEGIPVNQSFDLSQSNFDFSSKNIQLIEQINTLIAKGRAGAAENQDGPDTLDVPGAEGAENANANTDIRDIRRQFLSFAIIQKNSTATNVIIVVRKGIIYILNQSASEILQQVDTIKDIMKLMISQQNENLGAIKLNQMVDGYDHIIFKIKQRDDFIQYVLEYAQDNDHEINFDNTEQFQILEKNKPTLFRFCEFFVERETVIQSSPREQKEAQKLQGFLSLWDNRMKMWVDKCLILEGTILYVYKDANPMPTLSVQLTNEMEVKRGQDAGKVNVFTVKPSRSLPILKFMARNLEQYEKWVGEFKGAQTKLLKMSINNASIFENSPGGDPLIEKGMSFKSGSHLENQETTPFKANPNGVKNLRAKLKMRKIEVQMDMQKAKQREDAAKQFLDAQKKKN